MKLVSHIQFISVLNLCGGHTYAQYYRALGVHLNLLTLSYAIAIDTTV